MTSRLDTRSTGNFWDELCWCFLEPGKVIHFQHLIELHVDSRRMHQGQVLQQQQGESGWPSLWQLGHARPALPSPIPSSVTSLPDNALDGIHHNFTMVISKKSFPGTWLGGLFGSRDADVWCITTRHKLKICGKGILSWHASSVKSSTVLKLFHPLLPNRQATWSLLCWHWRHRVTSKRDSHSYSEALLYSE